MADRVGILLDGGFVTKMLNQLLGHFPSASDVVDLAGRIMSQPRLKNSEVFRIFYYDAPPLGGVQLNPIGARPYNFGSHPTRGKNQRLQDMLAQTPDVAVRKGETVFRGWRLRKTSLDAIVLNPRQLVDTDLAPDIQQKGVDLRIGLDVAQLSIKRIVQTIVLVSGDSDLVPAMKFARREGLRVYLDHMGAPVRPTLTEHSDFVLNSNPAPATPPAIP